MNPLNITLILGTTFLSVFLQCTLAGFRNMTGVQPDLLPGLVAYATLTSGLGMGTLTALCGGLWVDSLSHNPLGISIGPLFAAALVMERYRGMILRDQTYAQFLIGAAVSAGVPAATLLLLLNTSNTPLVGWSSLWQWSVMALIGGLLTPVWFWLFSWLGRQLNYETLPDAGSQSNRQIKRGRG